MSNINPSKTSEKVKLFAGVQKYLVGAVIVGQAIAITSMATYIVKSHNDSKTEMREFLEYFMKKNDELERDLHNTKETNKQLTEKTEQAVELLQAKSKKR